MVLGKLHDRSMSSLEDAKGSAVARYFHNEIDNVKVVPG